MGITECGLHLLQKRDFLGLYVDLLFTKLL